MACKTKLVKYDPNTVARELSFLFCVLLLFAVSTVVNARVFKEQQVEQSATASIDAGLNDQGQSYRKYLLNGSRVDGLISYTDYRPAELVSILNADWSDKASKVYSDEELGAPGGALLKPLVSMGEGWGMFANLNLLGTHPKSAGQPTLAEKYIVFSAESHSDGKSEVWVIKIPDETKPLSLFAPKEPEKKLPIYPGSTLGWSLVEAAGNNESELYVYSSSGSIAEHNEHYKRAFGDLGFLFDDEIEMVNGVRLLFSRGAAELDIFVQREQAGDRQIATIIQLRKRV